MLRDKQLRRSFLRASVEINGRRGKSELILQASSLQPSMVLLSAVIPLILQAISFF